MIDDSTQGLSDWFFSLQLEVVKSLHNHDWRKLVLVLNQHADATDVRLVGVQIKSECSEEQVLASPASRTLSLCVA